MRKRVFLILAVLLLFVNLSFAQDELINLKFKDTDIRIVLSAISKQASKDGKKINIITAPEVEAKVTLNLEGVNWETALEALLKPYNYSYEWVGENIIMVDTIEKISERRKKAEEAKGNEPLKTQVFNLNFAKVEDLQDTVRRLLTSRGKLTFDPRTNIFVITDTQTNLQAIEKALSSLDRITPQVLIEAKVIETDFDVTDKLGIKWNVTGSVSGAKRPSTWPFTSHSDNKYLRSNDFPAADSSLFNFGTIDTSSLSVTLDAILSDGHTEILSMPKITTMDNSPATINIVTQDPIPNYTYNSETGAWEISGYEWIKYGVSLEVTPQINQQGFITLSVKPEVSEKLRDKQFTSSSGSTAEIPVLNTQTTSTRIMVKDGQTLVIGGLLRDKTVNTITRVPILGDIPLLGFLFRHKNKSVEKKNLLIFITPTIVTPEVNISQNTISEEQNSQANPGMDNRAEEDK